MVVCTKRSMASKITEATGTASSGATLGVVRVSGRNQQYQETDQAQQQQQHEDQDREEQGQLQPRQPGEGDYEEQEEQPGRLEGIGEIEAAGAEDVS